MKNEEFEIRIVGNKGWTQFFHKEGEGWVQITKSKVRKCTAEQVMNHILPLLCPGNLRPFHVEVSHRDS